MRGLPKLHFILALSVLVATASCADAGQTRSSSRSNVNAVMNANGFSLRAAGTAEQGAKDLAPVQLVEIVRPSNQAITIGRLFTSCTCIVLEADKTAFAAGEPAILRLRNIQATPPQGQMYAVYVQLNSPVRTILRHDTFVQSSQFIPAPPTAAPTRGNIKADGIYTANTQTKSDIEIIVPKADHYIPDTSEYTLRKQAEKKAAEKAAAGKTVENNNERAKEAVKDTAKSTDKPAGAEKAPTTTASTNDAGDAQATGKPSAPAVAKPEAADETAVIPEEVPTEAAGEQAQEAEAADDDASSTPDEEGEQEEESVDEGEPATTETPAPEDVGVVEVISDEVVEVTATPGKAKRNDRAAARKEAMKRSMRAAEEMTDKAAVSTPEPAEEEAEGLGTQILKKARQAEEVVGEKAKVAGSAISGSVKSAAATASDKAKVAGAVIADKAKDAGEVISDTAKNAAGKAGKAVEAVKEVASDAVESLKD